MSRIGKQPIIIPAGVEININDKHITAKGPKGELFLDLHPLTTATKSENEITISVESIESKEQKSLWGTMRMLVSNMIEGVSKGFERKLEINGVGYNASVSGNKIVVNAGYSHPVNFDLEEGITAEVVKNVITVKGIDKQKVGETAAQIRKIRKPEPYKGKGIKYTDEHIRRKAGKAAKS